MTPIRSFGLWQSALWGAFVSTKSQSTCATLCANASGTEDPYVRKTAAVCVAKMHDINASLVEDQGFLDLLKDLLSDSNPMVVANAVAALGEICDSSPTARASFELSAALVNKLLTALGEVHGMGSGFRSSTHWLSTLRKMTGRQRTSVNA